MRRRILSLLLLALLPLLASARSISRDEAFAYAQKFFHGTDRSELTLAWTGGSQAAPAFYAINNARGGFVIISGEEAVDPVIGYSREGSFTAQGMPSNIRAWFSSLESDIAHVRAMGAVADARVLRKWQNLGEETRAGGELVLKTAQWDQSWPYNDLCYVTSTKKAVTGCVATAMSIFMRYMRYPERGKGSLPSYTTGTDRYRIEGYSIADHVYNWDIMPLNDADVKRASEEQRAQIAQIMHDCGVMVQMDYTLNSSGAHSGRVPIELAKHMGYSSGAKLCFKSMYSPEEWNDMLMSELDKNRPVMYSAQDASMGGHAFIIDGYDGGGKFHLNWGWGGSNNGFYTLDLKVSGYRFSVGQDMIVGVEPDPDGEGVATCQLEIGQDGIKLTDGSLAQNTSFSLKVNYIMNISPVRFNGDAVPALVDADGNVKEYVSQPESMDIPATNGDAYYYNAPTFAQCRITKPIEFKDKLVIMARTSADDPYEIVRHDSENGAVGYLSANPYLFIKVKPSYSAGDLFGFELLGGAPYAGVEWSFDGEKVYGGSVILTSGTHTVKAEVKKASGKETIIQEIVVK